MSTTPLSIRRPPAPHQSWASVTRLGPPGSSTGEPEDIAVATVQGTLALDLGRALVPPAPELHIVGPTTPESDQEVRAWAARFAQAVVEVLGGDRPVSQLLRLTTARVYTDLNRRVRILARTAPAPQRLRTIRPQVRSVHLFRPGPDAAEVSVHVRHGRRSRALAARLEVHEGHWTCTVLEFG
jgi:hypothetical protein